MINKYAKKMLLIETILRTQTAKIGADMEFG